MHNITETDQVFTVRKPAWHGLSHIFGEYPTRAEAQALAHPWEPVTEPVYRYEPRLDPETLEETGHYTEIPEAREVRRSDNGHTLGVVSSTYEPVKNAEMYDIAEAIEGEAKGSVKFETGGSLKGGTKVWLLIRLREPLVFGKENSQVVVPYYALQNAHDGSGSFRGQATMTAIVCDNTAQMADLDSERRGTSFTFRHSKNVKSRIEEAQDALRGWREDVQAYQIQARTLMDAKVTPEEQAEFLDRFLPRADAAIASERVRNNIDLARKQWREFHQSPTCEGIEDSAYGLVQASIEYAQHGRKAHSAESLFKRAYLDDSQVTRQAMSLAREIAHV